MSQVHAHHLARRRRRDPGHRNAPRASVVAERQRVIARLIEASNIVQSEPDAAALLLDGAISHLVSLWAGRDYDSISLAALEAQSPAIAGQVRLALLAREPAARLAHCWALLDLLTTTAMSTAIPWKRRRQSSETNTVRQTH